MLDRGPGSRSRWAGVTIAAALAAGWLCGCSQYKKLGTSPTDYVMYDMLGRDRSPDYYYRLVRDSHSETDFCYECGDDPYLVDKNIDAIQRLGDATFARLEGEAQVVELMQEVVSEDRSALARSSAIDTLTKLGLKLPSYPGRRIEDDGSAFLAASQELDRIYGQQAARGCPPASRQRVVQLVERIGDLQFPSFLNTKNALKLFYGRRYLVDERDPAIRQAIDTALVKRMDALIHYTLQNAVEDAVPSVRASAVRGLKALDDQGAVEDVLRRLEMEPDWLVRIEIVEYLGIVGTRDGVKALIGLLDDANASVRSKARGALAQIAGADYGFRAQSWMHWARSVDPSIVFEEEGAEDEAVDADFLR